MDNWNGHILRRNCFQKHVNEGKIERTRRQGRRRKQLLDDRNEATGYCKFKVKALDRTLWRTRYGRRNAPVAK
jgi:hypothetical protein